MSAMPRVTISISAGVRLQDGRFRPSIRPRAYSVFWSSVIELAAELAAGAPAGDGAGEGLAGACARAAIAIPRSNVAETAIGADRESLMNILSLAFQDPEQQGQHHAQDDAGDDREIESEIALSIDNVPGQAADTGDTRAERQEQANGHQQASDQEQSAAEIGHTYILCR